MTRRERREDRVERLRSRAERLKRSSEQRSAANAEQWKHIPPGQPHLPGHHSFKKTTRTQERLNRSDEIAYEEGQQAKRAAQRAKGIEAQLARDIYDDDPDAIDRLAERIAEREAQLQQMNAANTAFRKKNKEALKKLSAFERDQSLPYPEYARSNLRAQILRDRKRMDRLQREAVEPPQFKRIIARFDGECTHCGDEFVPGDTIRYNKQLGARCARECERDEPVDPQ